MIIKTAIKISIVFSTMLLSACDVLWSDDIGSICKHSPELCTDIHKIGDCPYKRTTMIRARYYDKIEPSEINKRKLLTELEEYELCLELTLFLQFTRNKDRKQRRLDNYLKTQELMQEQLKEIKDTQDPMLAYYLWTRHQNLQARNIFLKAAKNSEVTDSRLLFKLAAVNTKNDPQEALNIFYKALSMTTSLNQIPHSSFSTMMTLFYQNKQFEEAYVWAIIAEEEDKEDEFPINLELILKKGISSSDKVILNEDALEERAEHYYEQLEEGIFNIKAPLLK
ncbi:DUF2989 domain-containing protein [Psychromonas hadalis]|uniref:DUF2989 domain-containing protein n=1 Tax=Psychromonas hadalis TaxID=211669 RepID=UPI0003B66C7A|nr:DUF2989 domain-containing protein [Psychromonas hadalis]